VPGAESGPTESIGPDATGPAAAGLCTAWHKGKDRGARLDAPPFVNLAAAAAAQGLTTDEYCAEVLEARTAPPPGATAPGRETSATAPGRSGGNGNNGNNGNNGGNGNGGNGGNGNGGNGNGNGGDGGNGGGPPTNPGGPGATAPGKL
jgi:hypothetical protein